jgi:hypothetical protein
MLAAGWHAHLEILRARLDGSTPEAFWPRWQQLRGEYGQRLPA